MFLLLVLLVIRLLKIQKMIFVDTAEGVATAIRPYWSETTRGRATVVQSVPDMLEIVPPGTSKGSGVKMLLDHLEVSPKEVWQIYFSFDVLASRFVEISCIPLSCHNGHHHKLQNIVSFFLLL